MFIGIGLTEIGGNSKGAYTPEGVQWHRDESCLMSNTASAMPASDNFTFSVLINRSKHPGGSQKLLLAGLPSGNIPSIDIGINGSFAAAVTLGSTGGGSEIASAVASTATIPATNVYTLVQVAYSKSLSKLKIRIGNTVEDKSASIGSANTILAASAFCIGNYPISGGGWSCGSALKGMWFSRNYYDLDNTTADGAPPGDASPLFHFEGNATDWNYGRHSGSLGQFVMQGYGVDYPAEVNKIAFRSIRALGSTIVNQYTPITNIWLDQGDPASWTGVIGTPLDHAGGFSVSPMQKKIFSTAMNMSNSAYSTYQGFCRTYGSAICNESTGGTSAFRNLPLNFYFANNYGSLDTDRKVRITISHDPATGSAPALVAPADSHTFEFVTGLHPGVGAFALTVQPDLAQASSIALGDIKVPYGESVTKNNNGWTVANGIRYIAIEWINFIPHYSDAFADLQSDVWCAYLGFSRGIHMTPTIVSIIDDGRKSIYTETSFTGGSIYQNYVSRQLPFNLALIGERVGNGSAYLTKPQIDEMMDTGYCSLITHGDFRLTTLRSLDIQYQAGITLPPIGRAFQKNTAAGITVSVNDYGNGTATILYSTVSVAGNRAINSFYAYREAVKVGNLVYENQSVNGGTTSGGAGPSGTTDGQTDGTCVWNYIGDASASMDGWGFVTWSGSGNYFAQSPQNYRNPVAADYANEFDTQRKWIVDNGYDKREASFYVYPLGHYRDQTRQIADEIFAGLSAEGFLGAFTTTGMTTGFPFDLQADIGIGSYSIGRITLEYDAGSFSYRGTTADYIANILPIIQKRGGIHATYAHDFLVSAPGQSQMLGSDMRLILIEWASLRDAGKAKVLKAVELHDQINQRDPFVLPDPITDSFLENLTTSAGSINFDPNTLTYSLNVVNGVSTATVTAVPSDPSATMKLMNDGSAMSSAVASNSVNLTANAATAIRVQVISGSSIREYKLTVNRAANPTSDELITLSVEGYNLSIPFTPSNQNYTVETMPYSQATMNITAIAADPTDVVEIEGVQITGGGVFRDIPVVLAGFDLVPIKVGATSAKYQLATNRSNPSSVKTLSAMSFAGAALDSAFSSGDLSYNIPTALPFTTTALTLTAVKTSELSTLQWKLGAGGTYVSLANNTPTVIAISGNDTVYVKVIAEDGTSQEYTTAFTVAVADSTKTLSALSVSTGAFNEAFNSGTTGNDGAPAYTIAHTYSLQQISITATKTSAVSSLQLYKKLVGESAYTLWGSLTSGQASAPQIDLPVGLNKFFVRVTAEDGTTNDYYIGNTRNANASEWELTFSGATGANKTIISTALNLYDSTADYKAVKAEVTFTRTVKSPNTTGYLLSLGGVNGLTIYVDTNNKFHAAVRGGGSTLSDGTNSGAIPLPAASFPLGFETDIEYTATLEADYGYPRNFRLYVRKENGSDILIGTGNGAQNPTLGALVIGDRSDYATAGSFPWYGVIKKVRISKGATDTTPVASAALVAEWNIDDNSDTAIVANPPAYTVSSPAYQKGTGQWNQTVVAPKPSFTEHPVDDWASISLERSPVTFSATVADAVSLQWERFDGSTWSNIGGATTDTVTFDAQTYALGDAVKVRLRATNSEGTTYSNPATVKVRDLTPQGNWSNVSYGTNNTDANQNLLGIGGVAKGSQGVTRRIVWADFDTGISGGPTYNWAWLQNVLDLALTNGYRVMPLIMYRSYENGKHCLPIWLGQANGNIDSTNEDAKVEADGDIIYCAKLQNADVRNAFTNMYIAIGEWLDARPQYREVFAGMVLQETATGQTLPTQAEDLALETAIIQYTTAACNAFPKHMVFMFANFLDTNTGHIYSIVGNIRSQLNQLNLCFGGPDCIPGREQLLGTAQANADSDKAYTLIKRFRIDLPGMPTCTSMQPDSHRATTAEGTYKPLIENSGATTLVTQAKLTAARTTGSTSIAVDTVKPFALNEQVIIKLTNGQTHTTTITAVGTSTITIAAGLPSGASSGAAVQQRLVRWDMQDLFFYGVEDLGATYIFWDNIPSTNGGTTFRYNPDDLTVMGRYPVWHEAVNLMAFAERNPEHASLSQVKTNIDYVPTAVGTFDGEYNRRNGWQSYDIIETGAGNVSHVDELTFPASTFEPGQVYTFFIDHLQIRSTATRNPRLYVTLPNGSVYGRTFDPVKADKFYELPKPADAPTKYADCFYGGADGAQYALDVRCYKMAYGYWHLQMDIIPRPTAADVADVKFGLRLWSNTAVTYTATDGATVGRLGKRGFFKAVRNNSLFRIKVYDGSQLADNATLTAAGVERKHIEYMDYWFEGGNSGQLALPDGTTPGCGWEVDPDWIAYRGTQLEANGVTDLVIDIEQLTGLGAEYLARTAKWNLSDPATRDGAVTRWRELIAALRTTFTGQVGIYGGEPNAMDYAGFWLDYGNQFSAAQADEKYTKMLEHMADVAPLFDEVDCIYPTVYGSHQHYPATGSWANWSNGATYAAGIRRTHSGKICRVVTAGGGASTTAPTAFGSPLADGYTWADDTQYGATTTEQYRNICNLAFQTLYRLFINSHPGKRFEWFLTNRISGSAIDDFPDGVWDWQLPAVAVYKKPAVLWTGTGYNAGNVWPAADVASVTGYLD